jgi:hypothetical protein
MADALPGLSASEMDERVARARRRTTVRARLIRLATAVERLSDDELTEVERVLDVIEGAP